MNRVFQAVSSNDMPALTSIVQKVGANIRNSVDKTILHMASQIGNCDMVEFLTENGADVNAKDKYGFTPLTYAIEYGRTNLVQVLLDKGADIENYGYAHLVRATYLGNLEVMEMLVERGIDPNKKDPILGNTLLHIMSRIDQVYVVKKLIDLGAKINLQNKEGNTALHEAVYAGNSNTVKCLVEYNANRGFRNKEGLVPLEIAKMEGFTDMYEMLKTKKVV